MILVSVTLLMMFLGTVGNLKINNLCFYMFLAVINSLVWPFLKKSCLWKPPAGFGIQIVFKINTKYNHLKLNVLPLSPKYNYVSLPLLKKSTWHVFPVLHPPSQRNWLNNAWSTATPASLWQLVVLWVKCTQWQY